MAGGFSSNQIILFLIVLVRVTTAIFVFPLFNSNSIHAMSKIGFGVFLTLIIISVIPNVPIANAPTITMIIFTLAREVLTGLLLGFLVSMLFTAIELSGQLVSMQMGLGIVNVYDPQSERQIPIIVQFQVYLAMMIFLAIDGHHFLIEGLYQSFVVVPPTMAHFNAGIVELNMTIAGQFFVSAIKIGSPIIISLLLTNVALGLIARAVPQMNVFFVGMPIGIAMGLFIMAVSLPIFALLFKNMFNEFQNHFYTLLQLLSQ